MLFFGQKIPIYTFIWLISTTHQVCIDGIIIFLCIKKIILTTADLEGYCHHESSGHLSKIQKQISDQHGNQNLEKIPIDGNLKAILDQMGTMIWKFDHFLVHGWYKHWIYPHLEENIHLEYGQYLSKSSSVYLKN